MKISKYLKFIKENLSQNKIPTYAEAVELCQLPDSPFYESKMEIEGFAVSVFNYRLAQWKDFENPIPDKPNLKGYEMRGLTFVFNQDGTLFNRFILLEKFFNLNQVPDTVYSVVKNYKIKFINNKEDGSIASFIKLPNGVVIGKSKMGFTNEQSIGINRIYKTNSDVRQFVDWCIDNEIVAIFEYVSPSNRIVIRYPGEELVLLRMRDNKTGKHIDIRNHLDKIGKIRIAPFEDEVRDLDHLIELVATQVDKEGSIVTCEDDFGRDFFFKIKTPWYMSLHGLLSEDIYRENIIIGYILDDKIDDVLAQVPTEQIEVRERIEKIIKIVKYQIEQKVKEIKKTHQIFLDLGSDRKDFAIKYHNHPNFGYVMELVKGRDIYEIAKEHIRQQTKKLQIARDWLKKIDDSLFFQEPLIEE